MPSVLEGNKYGYCKRQGALSIHLGLLEYILMIELMYNLTINCFGLFFDTFHFFTLGNFGTNIGNIVPK